MTDHDSHESIHIFCLYRLELCVYIRRVPTDGTMKSRILALLLVILPMCSAQTIYYVKPTADTQCQVGVPESNCLTLAEYVGQADQYFTSETEFIFLPGDHILPLNASVRDINSLVLEGDTNSSPNIASRIVCTWPVGFFFQNIIHLQINSLAFTNCGGISNAAITMKSVDLSEVRGCLFDRNVNQISKGGALDIEDGQLTITKTSFSENFGGGVYANMAVVNIQDSTFTANALALLGGAVFASESNVSISGDTRMMGNSGQYGGGIAAVESTIEIDGSATIYQNTASYGGGIYAQESFMQFTNYTSVSSNVANYGGGVYALRSVFVFEGKHSFTDNSATINGGAMLFIGDSSCSFLPNTVIDFVRNAAEKTGGAIKADDLNPLTYCTDQDHNSLAFQTQCFFRVPPLRQYSGRPNITLNFYNNSAGDGGGDVFGGSIDNCEIPYVTTDDSEGLTSGQIFNLIKNQSANSLDIASVPLQICSCENNQLDCNSPPLRRVVYPGGTLHVSLAVLGQRSGVIADDVTIFLLPQSEIDVELSHITQRTIRSCTILDYTIRSLAVNQTHEKFLYPVQGPCPRVFLNISILVLPCPPGFELSAQGVCVCDKRLADYTDTCNADNGTILRDISDSFWVGIDDGTQELLRHPSCVYDYCIAETSKFISINNSDEQCNYNRTGIVCGGCREGWSAVLSSSRCLPCSNNYLALLVPFALAGIALVFLLFLLNLTVTAGTINGLIFYVNVLAASNIFSTGESNILTVFVAWLNLDLGIETCFYNGMDVYAYVWLQFAFPIYIWLLVALVVIASHYSSRIARHLGRNPISVLATLFLLSYTKLFRAICTVVSYTDVYYPSEGSRVWFEDPNVVFLSGKHVPLFLFAILVFLLFNAPFTLILLFGSLLRRSDSRLFAWVNSPKLMKPFLDAFYAPYKDNHHYWTGWLLLLRFILFLSFVINSFGDRSFNLFMIILGSFTTLILAWNTGGIYKNWCLDLLESFFFFQLGVFATGVYYVRAIDGDLAALSYTMLSVSLVVFIGIIIFHILVRVTESKAWKNLGIKASERLNKQKGEKDPEKFEDVDIEFASTIRRHSEENRTTLVTHTELREPLIDDSYA